MKTNEQLYKENLPVIQSIFYGAEQQVFNQTGVDLTCIGLLAKATNNESNEMKIINRCLEIWDVDLAYLQSKNRTNPRPAMRKIICMLLQKKTSLMTIAGILNYNDHSTVLAAIGSGKDLLDTHDYIFLKYYEPVKHLFNEA